MRSLHDNEAEGNRGDALTVNVAWFSQMKATKPQARWLGQVLSDIQGGTWRAKIDGLRAALVRDGKDVYDKEKVKLPSFYVSGTASTPTTMLTHTGFLPIDLDDLDDGLAEIHSKLIGDPHAAAVFRSPSGGGLKIVFRIKALDDPLDKHAHKRAFEAVTAYFRQSYGVTPDPSGKNVNRHCLVSYDPNLYRNGQAAPFDWSDYEKAQQGKREKDSSLSSQDSLCSLTSLGSLTSQPSPSIAESAEGSGGDFQIFDPEPIAEAFADAHPDLAKLYEKLLAKRQRPKQRTRNQCAVSISTFLLRAVSERIAMLMQGHWYDLYHQGRFKDSREQHLADAKAQWDNSLGRYVEKLSKQETQRYLTIQRTDMQAAFRILRDCALSPRDEAPPNFHMSWRQLSIRLGICSDKAGEIFDAFICSHIIKPTAPPVMYKKGVIGRGTRYRWLLPTT
jgi:hypothetical protein